MSRSATCTVVGGENGIDVDGVHGARLEHVTVSGAQLDGIHVRRAQVTIDGCYVESMGNVYAQGIDISYGFDKEESSVMGCRVVGGQEGIVTHFANAMIAHNQVSRTRLRGISMTEMSMGMIEHNEVRNALGVGIFCNDHSMCMVEQNVVVDTRPDSASGDLWRAGFGVLASYDSEAELKDNALASESAPRRRDAPLAPRAAITPAARTCRDSRRVLPSILHADPRLGHPLPGASTRRPFFPHVLAVRCSRSSHASSSRLTHYRHVPRRRPGGRGAQPPQGVPAA